MDLGLKNRSVIVAASSDGIARAAAEKFAAEGARVAMCSRDAAKLDPAAAEIRERYGAQVLAEALDVTDPTAVDAFVQRVAGEFGGIDVCVTNAGGPPAKMFFATTTEEWHRALELNFMSVIYMARAVFPFMQKNHWGRLVTITSMTVRQPVPDLIYSNAVRAGVLGLIKSLSNEFGKDGITVNNVGPGYTATERLKQLIAKRSKEQGISESEFEGRFASEAALKRIAQPEEVADAIVWLASERASFITGQTLLVDGGWFKGL
ncbi:MAG TPA: SDR family oxidoreductase [Acidobacteriaceae bacterium]|nr:SDR family oxidoreductase [Acidobacteriaceae bacterium]